MKGNSQQIVLPLDGTSATKPCDVSSAPFGLLIQTIGVAAAGATYVVEASMDGGTTWLDITSSFFDLSTGASAVTPPLATDSIFTIQLAIPGLVRLRATGAGTSPAKAYINWSDTRQS
jgi:hypothetical protein